MVASGGRRVVPAAPRTPCVAAAPGAGPARPAIGPELGKQPPRQAPGWSSCTPAIRCSRACCPVRAGPAAHQLFLDLDHQQRLVQPALEFVVIARELRDLQRVGPAGVSLGSALLRRQCGQVGGLALAPPGAQGGRVHALAAHQRADLTWARAAVRGLQNAALVGVGEMPAVGARHDLGAGVAQVGRRRRIARISSRPTGSLRCGQFGQTLRCVHCGLGLIGVRHTYLVAH